MTLHLYLSAARTGALLLGLSLLAAASLAQPARTAPVTATEWLAEGKKFEEANQMSEARAAYRSAIAADSTLGLPYLRLAKTSVFSGGLDSALALATLALRRDSSLHEAYALRGAIAGQFYSKIQGILEYSMALRLDSTNADYSLQRAILYFEREDNDRALADLRRAARYRESDALTHLYLGYVHMAKGEAEPARLSLLRCLEIDSNRVDALVDLGNVRAAQNEPVEALGYFATAIRRNPRYARAYYARASQYTLSDRYADAVADLDVAVSLVPSFQQAFELRGQTHLNLKNYERAIADCDTAIQLRATPAAYVNRSNGYYNLKRFQEALPDANSAVNLDPLYPQAYLMRALVRLQLDLRATGCADLRKAEQLGLLQAKGLIKKQCETPPPTPAPAPTPNK